MKRSLRKVNNTILVIVVAIIMLTSGAKGKTKEVGNDNIPIMHRGCNLDVKLYLLSKQDLSLKIVATNNLPYDIALPKYCINIFDDRAKMLTNTYIEVINEFGDSPEYTGILCKLGIGTATLDQCCILKTGESIEISVSTLLNSYDFDNFAYEELHIQYGGFLGVSNEIVVDRNIKVSAK